MEFIAVFVFYFVRKTRSAIPRRPHNSAGRAPILSWGGAVPWVENYRSQEAPPPALGRRALRAMHLGNWSFFTHRSSPDRPGGCAGDPRALRGAGRAGRAQCGRAWAGGGYQVTVSVCLSICVCIPPPGTAPRAPGRVAAKMAAVAEAGASWAPPPARSRRVGRSEAAPLLRCPKAKRSSGQPGPREWRPAVEEEPGRVTSPPARGEPPSPAPGAARCPFPVPFPWWRRGRAGAVGQGSGLPGWGLGAGSGLGGRCGAAGKPCGAAGCAGRAPRTGQGALSALQGDAAAFAAAEAPWAEPAYPRSPRRSGFGAGKERDLCPPPPGWERLARLRQWAVRPAEPPGHRSLRSRLRWRRRDPPGLRSAPAVGIGAGRDGGGCGRWGGPGAGSCECRTHRPEPGCLSVRLLWALAGAAGEDLLCWLLVCDDTVWFAFEELVPSEECTS